MTVLSATKLPSVLAMMVAPLIVCNAQARAESLDELYEKAKLEKTVVLYGAGPTGSHDRWIREFQQRFPGVTVTDNIRMQRRLLTERLGVERIALVYGWSMGALQAYHWAALFPDAVERAIVVCGSARTAEHNKVFLSGLLRTFEAAPKHLGNGRFAAEPLATLRAIGHIYAGWALSQDFYREKLHITALGGADLESYLRNDWEASFARRRAANCYAQLVTWYHGDISANTLYHGDLTRALKAIKARVLLLPSETDLYFRVADNADGRWKVAPELLRVDVDVDHPGTGGEARCLPGHPVIEPPADVEQHIARL